MIFVTVGSQKFQFNRLLKWLDNLVINKVINEEVVAQIGYSEYVPKYFKYKKFLDRSEFSDLMGKSDLVITHAGTGAIIKGLKLEKKVIAVPRNMKYDEHVDNHQYEIANTFYKNGYILIATNISEFEKCIDEYSRFQPRKYISNTTEYIKFICRYIEGEL